MSRTKPDNNPVYGSAKNLTHKKYPRLPNGSKLQLFAKYILNKSQRHFERIRIWLPSAITKKYETMKCIYLTMLTALMLPALAFAQPTNDDCSGAIAIGVNGAAVVADNTEATYSGPEGSCYAPLGDMTDGNVWFTFSLLETTTVLISTEAGTSDDSQITLFTIADCGEPEVIYNEIGCSEDIDFIDYMSSIFMEDLASGTYYISASTFSRADADGGPISNAGTYSISITSASLPDNDSCEGAVELILDGASETADNSISTIVGPEGSCYSIGQEVGDTWFTFTLTETTSVRVATEEGTSTDSQVSVYTIEGCGTGSEVYTEVGCNDDTDDDNYMSTVDMIDLPAGTYYVKAGTYHSFFTGDYSISIETLSSVGINEADLSANFSVYPNPTSGDFKIVNSDVSGDYSIELLDLTGRAVYTQNSSLNANSETSISLNGIAPGVYVLNMKNINNNGFATQRVVVQ